MLRPTFVLATIGLALVVVSCDAPIAPRDATLRASVATRRVSVAKPRASVASPLLTCTSGTVEVYPCYGSINVPANANDTITFHYTNLGTRTYPFEATDNCDGVVVLTCVPSDTVFDVAAHHSVLIKYHFRTAVKTGAGQLSVVVSNNGNSDITGSSLQVYTH